MLLDGFSRVSGFGIEFLIGGNLNDSFLVDSGMSLVFAI